ncbi:MAG: hypothetical protein Q8N98_05425 [bacterium]|nr:hypothetical protein [bacterium]
MRDERNGDPSTSLDALHSRALAPLPAEIEALIRVTLDVRVLTAARQQAETISGNPNLSGIETHHIFAHGESDGEAHCNIYSFSPPFHPIGTENWRDVLSLLRQKLEADEVIPAIAGAVGMVRDEANSEIRQRETAITKSGGKITNREKIFVSGRGFGFIIESQTEGYVCHEVVFRYHDGTRLAMTLNQPPGSPDLGSDIEISVAEGGEARLQEIIARPLEGELRGRLVANRQEQARVIVDQAQAVSEQEVARRTAELHTSLQALSPVLASVSPKAARDIALDTLFVTETCASPPEDRSERPNDADRVIFTLTEHPLWAACFPLTGGTIALVLGEREEDDLETTTVFLPSEKAQKALEEVTGLSLRGRQDLGHAQVVAVNYDGQPIAPSGGDLSLARLAGTQAAKSLPQLPESPPVLPGFLQPVEKIVK